MGQQHLAFEMLLENQTAWTIKEWKWQSYCFCPASFSVYVRMKPLAEQMIQFRSRSGLSAEVRCALLHRVIKDADMGYIPAVGNDESGQVANFVRCIVYAMFYERSVLFIVN